MVVTALATPVTVQPPRSPVSKLPLTTTFPPPGGGVVEQPEPLLPTKQMEWMAWSSIALGATPVWPWGRSKNPTPVTVTGTLAVWKMFDGVNFAVNAARAEEMAGPQEPPPTQCGAVSSAIIV